jgi:hypothetical protein
MFSLMSNVAFDLEVVTFLLSRFLLSIYSSVSRNYVDPFYPILYYSSSEFSFIFLPSLKYFKAFSFFSSNDTYDLKFWLNYSIDIWGL